MNTMSVIHFAILGLIGGFLGLYITTVQRKGIRKKFLEKMRNEGHQAARRFLDVTFPSVTDIALGKVLHQQERMAGLTILNNVQAIEGEIAAHKGQPIATAQVCAIGLLGIALRNIDSKDAVGRLDVLATRFEHDGGTMTAGVKKKIRLITILATGLTGAAIPSEMRIMLDNLAENGSLLQILVWQAIAQSLEKAGVHPGDAREHRQKVNQLTDAFAD